MVVIYGDAPVWKFCKLFRRAMAEGAAVIAIGDGIDIFKDASDCIVAYSCEEEYAIGKPISQHLGRGIRVPDHGEQLKQIGDGAYVSEAIS